MMSGNDDTAPSVLALPEEALTPDVPAAPAAFALDLTLPTARAARLARHPAFAGRTARARTTAETLIWLDTAEGTAAA